MKTNHTAEIEVDLKCSALDTTFLLAALLCVEFSHKGGIFKSNFHLHPDDEPHEVIVKTAYLEVENGNHIDAIETFGEDKVRGLILSNQDDWQES
jgi:hypothetical protein